MLPKKFVMIICLLALGAIALTRVHAQDASIPCEMVNHQEQMLVFFAPMYAFNQIKDILPIDTPYTVLAVEGSSTGYYRIEYGEGERGWIDFHTRIMNNSCETLIPITAPLSDFPTVCFYTPTEPQSIYVDAELTQARYEWVEDFQPKAIDSRTDVAIGLFGDSARHGGYMHANLGTYSGHCDGTLQLATTLENARVWTEPNAVTGQAITPLEAGIDVGIIEGPVQGALRADSDLLGDWYKIRRGEVEGWVWDERLVFGRTFTAPRPSVARAIVLQEARVWSEPDVTTGQIVTALATGLNISIMGEPVEGFIRLDPATQGTWLPVQLGGTTGWVLAERLSITD